MKPFFYGILAWNPNDIYNNSNKNQLNGVQNTKAIAPDIKNTNGQSYVLFNGNYFVQDLITIQNNVINIYVVYKLNPIASTADTSFTIQNALFGAMEITKNDTNNSKINHKGYGICFDEGSDFSHTITEGGFTHTTDGRNVLIFGADMSFSAHAINRANNTYLTGKGLIQGINGTTIYVERNYYRNFTDPG